ncbi:MAG: cyanase [Planctomycetes bacterium]|nr:cyanase [Planctomycetota bacterium]
MTRCECTAKIMAAKQSKGLTFQNIATAIGRDPVWTAAALHGQGALDAAEAGKIAELLGLEPAVAALLQQRDSPDLPMPPTDPLIYRFYEIVLAYGPTLREVIREEFGDGIMSAIDFSMNVERVPNPKGDRVRVTMEGKFLSFTKW